MDSVLNALNTSGQATYFTFSEEPEFDQEEKVSLWTIEGDIIRPSTSLKIRKKFPPGVFKVDISREIGYYSSKIDVSSDGLYKFNDEIINETLTEINKFWDKAEEYKAKKVLHKRGILFYGGPGCGKSSIISLLCSEVIKRNGVIFVVSSVSNLSIYTNFLKHNFRVIEPDTPIITIIEDLDKYTDSDELLDFLDGKSQIEHHLVLTTSNNTRNIPETFTRPSRIDLRIEVSNPTSEVRKEYFKVKGVKEELLDEYTEKTDGFSFADIKEIYLATTLLDYSLESAIKKLTAKTNKKDFSSKSFGSSKLAL